MGPLWLLVVLSAAGVVGGERGGAAVGERGSGAGERGGAPVGGRLPLGVTYSGWRRGFERPDQALARFGQVGFSIVSFVPAYAYVDRNRIDFASGPSWEELGGAVEAALRAGFEVVVKPHLDPAAFSPGFDVFATENASWRIGCPWRGFFDVDPMSPDYRQGIVLASLRMLRGIFDRLGESGSVVRLELGVELMDSVVEFPERWAQLLGEAQRERKRLGLEKRVSLSHNFSHHIQIPADVVDRMDARGRRALGRYVAGLDAVAVSQYMDLTSAMPPAERGRRLPTPDEVADALVAHERAFTKNILEGALGIPARRVPPLHIGEFGVGRGGLKHPNLYAGATTPAQDAALAREVAAGHQGLLRYLARGDRRSGSAVLWVTGPRYDVFGWRNPAYGIPAAAAAIRAALAPTPAR